MKAAGEYCEGKISFAEFVRRNDKDWHRMARYLLRRFPLESMAEEDVVQELLIGSWQALGKYNADRRGGMTPESFVTFRGISHAKKRMLRTLRPALEVLTDELEMCGDAPEQDIELARARRLRDLIGQCKKLTDAVCLIAYYREEDCMGAAVSVYNDVELRRLCRFGSLPDAARKVRRVLQQFHPNSKEEHGLS